jgi:hypothetical protein
MIMRIQGVKESSLPAAGRGSSEILRKKLLNPGILESSNPFYQLNGRRTIYIEK